MQLAITELNFKIQLVIVLLFILIGFYFELNTTEWMMQTLAIGLVLGLEALNTSLERSLDAIHPAKHSGIGLAKDMAAGAVLIGAITAFCLGLIIYWPKVF